MSFPFYMIRDNLLEISFKFSTLGIGLSLLISLILIMFYRTRIFGATINQTYPLSITHTHSHLSRVRNYSREAYESIIETMPVKIDTKIYKDLHKRWPKIYPKSVPESEIDLTVEYVDTDLEANTSGKLNDGSTKVIIALGGNPGYFTHFVQQINHFRSKDNVRIISPDWPKFEHTRASKGVYWHSIPERLLFIKAFLRKLNVKQIDCLIGHSFAIQTIGAFWENSDEFHIRSVMLLAPQPNWTLDTEFRKKNIMKFALLFRHELWYSFLERTKFASNLNRLSPVKFKDTNELLTSATHILDDQSPIDLKHRLEFLRDQTDISLKVIFGSNDSLILKQASDKINELIGLQNSEDIIHIHPQNISLNEFIPSNNRIASYVMHGGGHFAHAKFGDYYNKMIENLLERS